MVGIGCTVDEFKEGKVKGSIIKFTGLLESMGMIADGLSWKLDGVKETHEPVLAEKRIETPMKIDAGKVYGFDQVCRGIKAGQEVIILEELARVGPGVEAMNTIRIEGIPDILETMTIPPSNVTAAAHAVNLVPHILKAKPGLITMKDLHSVSLYQGLLRR
jgi:4-hydroxy-tetrahydrodipicolinate reductase